MTFVSYNTKDAEFQNKQKFIKFLARELISLVHLFALNSNHKNETSFLNSYVNVLGEERVVDIPSIRIVLQKALFFVKDI